MGSKKKLVIVVLLDAKGVFHFRPCASRRALVSVNR
jgi:hypothetical protein